MCLRYQPTITMESISRPGSLANVRMNTDSPPIHNPFATPIISRATTVEKADSYAYFPQISMRMVSTVPACGILVDGKQAHFKRDDGNSRVHVSSPENMTNCPGPRARTMSTLSANDGRKRLSGVPW